MAVQTLLKPLAKAVGKGVGKEAVEQGSKRTAKKLLPQIGSEILNSPYNKPLKALDFSDNDILGFTKAVDLGQLSHAEADDLVKKANWESISDFADEGNAASLAANRNNHLEEVFTDEELVRRVADTNVPVDERIDLLNEPNIDRAFKGEAQRVKDFAKSTEGQLLLDQSYAQYAETGTLGGLADKIRGLVPRNKVGKGGIDTVNKTGITLQSLPKRAFEDLKRKKTTTIPLSKVQALAEKFGASPEQVDAFMKMQKEGFRQIDKQKKEINRQVKAKLNQHPEWAAAVKKEIEKAEMESIGHIRAAHSFEDSADIISNLELENLSLNTARSNKDELPEAVAIAFGASKNLEEEFLKFLDPQLGNFWKEMDFKKKTQIRKLLEQIDPETGEKWNIDDALKEVGFGGSNQTQNIPGVLTSPGADKDPALKATLNKLAKDGPSSLDSSGFGGRTNISDRD